MTSHKLAIVKAGAAVQFVYHEVKLALIDAQSSPLLSKLISPLTGLDSKPARCACTAASWTHRASIKPTPR